MSDESLYSLELRIAKLLRTGVLIAGVLIFIGWMTLIQLQGDPFTSFQVYEEVSLRSQVSKVLSEGKWGSVVCYVGLFVLVSLPSLRVLLTAILFVKRREYLLAAIAAFVLAVLAASFSLGIEL